MKHLILYDGTCGVCHHSIQFVINRDKQKKFLFAPLEGETAKKVLPIEVLSEDTLVLIENYQTPEQEILIRGIGVLRILWILGGPWKLIGWKSFLPAALFDWFYIRFARNRYKISKHYDKCLLPTGELAKRFLP